MVTLYSRLYTGSALLHHSNLHLKFVEYSSITLCVFAVSTTFAPRFRNGITRQRTTACPIFFEIGQSSRRIHDALQRVFVRARILGIRPCTNTWPSSVYEYLPVYLRVYSSVDEYLPHVSRYSILYVGRTPGSTRHLQHFPFLKRVAWRTRQVFV